MLAQEVIVTTPVPAITLAVPSTGRHLRIRAHGRSDAPYDHISVGLQFNGDIVQNYSWIWDQIFGGPATSSLASGGDDEPRARVGLVPGAALLAGVPYTVGDVDIAVPNYLSTTFLKGFTFRGGENLGITRDISVHGHGTWFAHRAQGGGTSAPGISADSFSRGSDVTSVGQSWSHTIDAGNELLIVGVSHVGETDGVLVDVLFHGASFTRLGSVRRADNVCWTSLWLLRNPDVGTHTIQTSFSAPTRHSACAGSYKAMLDAAPIAVVTTHAIGAQSPGFTVPGPGYWAVLAGQSAGPSAGANLVGRQTDPGFGQFFGDSGAALAPGSQTVTMNGPDAGTAIAALFAPAGTGNFGSGGSLSTPEPITSVTILLDVGNWVAGSRVQLYVED